MRALLSLAALALAACAPPQNAEQAAAPAQSAESAPAAAAQPAGCTASRSRTLTYFGYRQPLTLEAHAQGPNCTNAVVTLVLRDPDGRPLWVIAGAYHGLATLGDPEMMDDPVSQTNVEEFLARWIQPSQQRAGEMPDWPEGVAALEDVEEGGPVYFTPYERSAYLALRQRNLPMLCFINGWESAECLIIDPASHAPSVFVRFGV